ncbi:hypothetical protein ASE03_29365 [Kitasatospora sp. Root187]|uniref:hypothetical protein n=1 Tax=Kitasatospora sp. Root187 TaxID=1736486 RepID=UPI0007107D0D|nr:hypothetical protein [Kitasatospora sp. Root187]KRB68063.1 hypothetical protein ASE03_29365 [Kitasatospora sp. Root187]
MSEMFGQELHAQLDQAREELALARAAGDEDGMQAYAGRVAGLLRLAAHHGVQLPHETQEEDGES